MLQKILQFGDYITVRTFSQFSGEVNYNGSVKFAKGDTFTLQYHNDYFDRLETVTFEGFKVIKETKHGYMLQSKNAMGEVTKTIEIEFR